MKALNFALAFLVAIALLCASCEKSEEIVPERNAKITYGLPKFSILPFSSSNLKDRELSVPHTGGELRLEVIAVKPIYLNGVLSDRVKQVRVSDMQVEITSNWLTLEKNAPNDSTLHITMYASENILDDVLLDKLTVVTEGEKISVKIIQDRALIEYAAPEFQSDYKDELLFSRSGDITRKIRFRAISRKIINGKVTEEYKTLDIAGWTWGIDRTDVFYIVDDSYEDPGIKVLTVKAQPNLSGETIRGILTFNFHSRVIDGEKGTISVPLTSCKDLIIDIDDGRIPEFH